MGLDFSHGDASCSYRSFNRFRSRLAAAIGLDWEIMCPSDPPSPNAGVLCGWTQQDGDLKDKSWAHAEKHPIYPLLNHSDCDGQLTPEECLNVASGIRSIVSLWPDDDRFRGFGERLAESCDLAAAAGENLEFM